MGSAGFKHSPAWIPSHTSGVTEEDLTSHSGSEKHKGLSGNHSPLSTDGALVYGGFALRKHPHCMKMDTHDSNHAGETCFLGNGLLLADRSRCGGGSISVDDIPDIQVPGSYGTESDLLFHIPSNMMSFQQAELLQQPTCKEEINSNQVTCYKSSDLLDIILICTSCSLFFRGLPEWAMIMNHPSPQIS